MIHRSLFGLFMVCCLISVPGCGGGGGEAAYDPSAVEAQSAEEKQAMDDYNEQMMKESADYYKK